MTRNRDVDNILLLGFLFLVSVLLINPIREFPLNDDWSYCRTAFHLLQTGEFKYTYWAGVPLVPHLFWGMAFIKIFGFSFSILRLSNLIMALLGIIVTYKILADLIKNKGMAFLLSLFILFNPLYYSLSFTFMTDLTFYSLSLVSILFYIQYFRSGKNIDMMTGTLFSVLATLVRQIGLFVPFAMFLLHLIIYFRNDTKKITRSFIHLLVPAVALFIFNKWLEMTGNLPAGYRGLDEINGMAVSLSDTGWRAFTYTGNWLNEAGILFFPLILVFLINSWTLVRKHWKTGLILLVILAVPIIRMNAGFPNGNILFDTGIGPRTLSDIYMTGTNHQIHSQPWVITLVRALAMTGGMMLVFLFAVHVKESLIRFRHSEDMESLIKLFSALMILVYQAVLLISFCYFDRYLLGIMIPLLILIFPFRGGNHVSLPLKRYIVIPFLVAMSAFSIFATKDYLSWNSARWDLAGKLMDEGIPAKKIDGGFEFNGWYGSKFDLHGKWNEKEFGYLVTFGEVDGMETLMTETYQNLLPYESRKIFVLRKAQHSERYIPSEGMNDPG